MKRLAAMQLWQLVASSEKGFREEAIGVVADPTRARDDQAAALEGR
jgi:hypothetical protein